MAIFSSLKHLFSHKDESENKEVESIVEKEEENPYEAYRENFDENKNTPYTLVEEVEPYMIEVCGVVYESGKVYYYESNGFDLKKGDAVIVNSTNGPRGAIVVLGNHFIDPDSIKGLSVVSAIVERNVYGLSEEERTMKASEDQDVKEEVEPLKDNSQEENVQEENSEVVSSSKASEIFNEEVKPLAVEEENDESHEQAMEREFEYVLKTFRSSKAKLINSTDELKKAYNDILNVAHKYKKGRVRSSFTRDMICIGRTRAAILKVSSSGKNMRLYLNLDDSYLDIKKYHLKSYANKKTYARTPLRIRVKSERSIKYALELLDQVFINANALLERHPKEYVNYSAYLVPMSEEEMLERGLIKKKMVKQYKTFFNK